MEKTPLTAPLGCEKEENMRKRSTAAFFSASVGVLLMLSAPGEFAATPRPLTDQTTLGDGANWPAAEWASQSNHVQILRERTLRPAFSSGMLAASVSHDPLRKNNVARAQILVRDSRTGLAVTGYVVSSGTNATAFESSGVTGNLSFVLPAGASDLEIVSPKYRPLRTAFRFDEGTELSTTIWLDPLEVQEELKPEVVLSRLHPGMMLIHGHVVDSVTAQPLENVIVHLSTSGSGSRTDSNGYFWFLAEAKTATANLQPPATDNLIATVDGYKTYTRTNVLLREGDVHLIVDMQEGTGSTFHDGTHKLLRTEKPSDFPGERAAGQLKEDSVVNAASLRISPQSVSLPSSIRVGFNCPTALSCTSVQVYSLETYVANGLDDEWLASWTAESLKAGAVAYRSYGAWHVTHPKTGTYDICSTAACQVNDPTDSAGSVQSAAAATAGVIVVNSAGTEPFFAEYSAHNNNSGPLCSTGTCTGNGTGGYTWTSCGDGFCGRPPTWPCLYDPVDAGSALAGHGGGMSQWGSYRWDQQGQSWQWIVNHYYNDNGNPSGGRNGVLQSGTTSPTVTINSASTPSQTTGTTSTFTINYNVTSSAATTVMLGASLRLHGGTTLISDPAHDSAVSLPAGTTTVSRQFSVSAAAGVYDLLVAVWRDQNNSGTIDGPDQQLSALTLQSYETLSTTQSCNTLTLLRSPSNGGTISATPSGSIPCNVGLYLTSTPITLTALPASGFQFIGWSGSGGSFSTTSQATTTFTITGAAQVTAAFAVVDVACTYSISPPTASGAGSGGNGSIQVTGSPSGCTGNWSASASSTGGWLTLTGTTNSSGSGTWQVPYSYPLNPSTTSSRAGTVSFTGSFPSGGTFTLTQSPSTAGACSYSIAPGSSTAPASSGAGSIQVTGSPSGCTGSWSSSASSTGGWLSLTGTTSGSGAGPFQVPYSYASNPSTTSNRVGTVVFSGSLTATFTLTQDAAAGGRSDLIVDGGFESATASGFVAPGWGITASPGSSHWLIIKNGPYAHAGVTYASLGGENLTQYDWLMQTVTIPSDATASNLTAWINVTTQEALGDNVYDILWVVLYDLNGNPITTLRQLSNQDAVLSNNTLGNYFQVGPFDLSAYKGSTVQIAFVAFTDSILPTTFLIDDVSLQVSGPPDNPPTTSITTPANGATVSGTVNVAATAADDHAVTSLEIDIDGSAKASNTNSTSLSYSWNTALASNGQHQISSKASDGAGHVSTSSIVTVTVSNGATLVITKSGTGSGSITSSPSGIDCGNTCQFSFAFNTQVTLTATAAAGSSFTGWSGACAGSSPQCTVTMSQARNVTASFNSPPVASAFYVFAPCRIIDTRESTPLANAATRDVTMAGVCGIPQSAVAVSANITAVAPASGGFLAFYPTGSAWPGNSTINYRTGKTRANNAILRLSGGKTTVLNSGLAQHFIVDVTGYFQ